jgi:predicted transcriptional regulator
MSTIELKEFLKAKIDEIDNESFLHEINAIFKNKSIDLSLYNYELQQSEMDIELGDVIPHNDVLENIKEWKKR